MMTPMRRRLSTPATFCRLITLPIAGAGVSAAPMEDSRSDPWVATDALGRKVPTFTEVRTPRADRTVGISAVGKDHDVPPQNVVWLANALKTRGRDAWLIHREEGGHATNDDDARAIIEFVIQKARPATHVHSVICRLLDSSAYRILWFYPLYVRSSDPIPWGRLSQTASQIV